MSLNAPTFWTVSFSAANSVPLVPGIYEGALRFAFSASRVGLDLSGDGRGCNQLTGRFVILEAESAPERQRDPFCGGSRTALRR